MIDLLEPRRLFTTVASAEATLTADVTTLKSDLTAVAAAAGTDVAAVSADLKALPKTAANRAAIKTTAAAESALVKLLTGGISKLGSTESVKVKRIVSDGLIVLEHPGNTADLKKLTAVLSTTESSVRSSLTVLGTAAEAKITDVAGDLADIVLANPTDTQLTTDIFNDGTAVTADLTKLEGDAQTFETDIAALIAVL